MLFRQKEPSIFEGVLRIQHGHAFLVRDGTRLPFTPRGEVFYIR